MAAEGVKMCNTLCHLATLLPDPIVATSDVPKSAPSLVLPTHMNSHNEEWGIHEGEKLMICHPFFECQGRAVIGWAERQAGKERNENGTEERK